MKQFIATTVLCLLFPAAIYARQQSFLARVTVYWASGGGGSDACTRAHKCSTGERLRSGHCAVDPKKIPYGSKVIFPDATCVAVDTGRDVINRKAARRSGKNAAQRSALVIDRFFETKRQALTWANSHPHFMILRVESPNEGSSSSRSPLMARKNAGGVRAGAAASAPARRSQLIPRSSSVAISQNRPTPQKNLLADNRDYNRLTLSRRF